MNKTNTLKSKNQRLSSKATHGLEPLVSIICLTFNQERYIPKAINSILSQRTNFNYEILIHDDASTDRTIELLRGYENKNPQVFKLFLETKNQFSNNNFKFVDKLFKASRGKYVAICEGDDYWIDENKLQKQVDFLEKNNGFAICFNPSKIIHGISDKNSAIFPDINQLHHMDIGALLKNNFIPTSSVMYRRQNYKKLSTDILPVDLYLHIYHAKFGKIGIINDVLSVYRRHTGGIWIDSDRDKDKFWKEKWETHLLFYSKIKAMLKNNTVYVDECNKSISNIFYIISDLDKRLSIKLLPSVVKKYPDLSVIALYSSQNEVTDLINSNNQLTSENKQLKNEMINIKYSSGRILRRLFKKLKSEHEYKRQKSD